MGYPSRLQSCWPGTERHGSFVFCSETSGLAEQKLQGVSSVIISITHHLLGDVPDEGGSFAVKIQTEVRGERPLNFPEIINLLSMKRSGIGCHDFSLRWCRGATPELRVGLAALLQGQEPLPGLRLAGPETTHRLTIRGPGPAGVLQGLLTQVEGFSASVASRRCQQVRAQAIALRSRSEMLGRISRMPGNMASAAGWYPDFSLHFEQPPEAHSTRLRLSHSFHFPRFIWLLHLKDQAATGQFWALGDAGG